MANRVLAVLAKVSCNKNSKCSDIQVGEVVLLKDENTPTQMWKLGHVHDLIQSADGLVRTAIVRTNTGREGKQTVSRRAVKHLVPLEVRSTRSLNIKVKKELQEPAVKTEIEPRNETNRPRRNAACIGEIKRRDHT